MLTVLCCPFSETTPIFGISRSDERQFRRNCVVSPHVATWGGFWHHDGMNSFAILRVSKLKSTASISRLLKHCTREAETPNADPELTHLNTFEQGPKTAREASHLVRELLPEKVRKNGVLAIDYVITASPEKLASMSRGQQDAYFAAALRWIKEKHGSQNVVSAVVHRDEKSPHMHALVVPIDPAGKLNCRHFLGGAKALSDMQSDFANSVREFGLERGIKGSKAQHRTLKEYYASVNSPGPVVPKITAPEPTVSARLNPKEYGTQVVAAVLKQVAPSWNQAVAKGKELELVRAKLEERESTLKSQQGRYSEFSSVLDSIPSPAGKKRAVTAARAVAEALEHERQAEINAEAQEQQNINDLLFRISQNMCEADPTISEKEGWQLAHDILSSGETEELEKWLEWKPEPKQHVAVPPLKIPEKPVPVDENWFGHER